LAGAGSWRIDLSYRKIDSSSKEGGAQVKKLLTPDEVCRILRIKKKHLYELTSERRIPYYKVGRFLRFDNARIQEWLRKRFHGDESKKLEGLFSRDGSITKTRQNLVRGLPAPGQKI